MAIKEKFDLIGQAALVTGGARGIGRACAEGLAEFGADVAIADLHEENLNKTVPEVAEQYGVRTEGIICDCTDAAAVTNMVQRVVALFGKIDILVNSVGITIWEDAEKMTEEQWYKVMDTNLNSTFLCCQAAAQHMIKQQHGSIISVASMSAHIVNIPQNQVAYNASKAAIIHMTRSMAAEWAKYNVRVNTISPGYTLTEMTKTVPEYHEGWCELIPMKRMAEPEELIGAVVYLASDAASYTTGEDIIIDGGYMLW